MSVETIRVEPRNTRGWPKTKQQLAWGKARIQKGLTAHGACLDVGYSVKYAQKKSHELERAMTPFLAYLQERKNEVAEKRYDATTERVLLEIASIAFSNPQDYVRSVVKDNVPILIGKPLNELDPEASLAVKSWNVERIETDDGPALDYKYVLYNKRSALIDLGRHLGMFNERILLEMNLRHAHIHRIDYSSVPTDKLAEIIETLSKFKEIGITKELPAPE